MLRLPRIEGMVLVRAMQRDGFVIAHIKGSHYVLQKTFDGGQIVTVPVPVHAGRILKVGTLSGILRKARISRARLLELLEE